MPLDETSELPTFEVGEKLTADDLNTLRNAIRDVVSDYVDNFNYQSPPAEPRTAIVDHFVGCISGSSSAAVYQIDAYYAADRAKGGSHANAPATRIDNVFTRNVTGVNLAELNTDGRGLTSYLPSGTRVHVFATYARNKNQDKFYFFDRPIPKSFPVVLSKTGGSDGGSNTACTWTYDANDLYTGGAVGSALTPKHQRPNGSMKFAKIGLACPTNGAAVVLWWTDETPNTDPCT